MPGPLRDVEQKISLDASGYDAGARRVVEDNIAIMDSIRDTLNRVGELHASFRALPDSRTITVTTRYVTAGEPPPDLGDVTRTVTTRYVNSGDPGTGRGIAADPAVLRELRDSSASLDMLTSTLGRVEEHMAAMRRDMADSSADLMAQTQILRDNADAHNAAATAVAALAAAGRGGRGGGGALAAAAGAAAGGGGGGGGGAAAAGGFLGALRPSNVFGGALPTLQMAHMITMFTMEALSTIVPAAVAAGAAGMVGLQAGQQLYTRGTAMWTAAEALGGAYGGQTLGTMTGLSSNLQRAQDTAQGGVFGIAGGLKDLVGQGSGAFAGMGVQTIAMIDRGIAGMVLSNRMSQVTSALAGGTGFLRSFGDIGANIGDTLLNLAPNLPGIGPDLLGGLKGITGAAAWTTGHVPGPLLGAGLAAEAGFRWGGPALSGGKLPGWLGGAKFGGLAGMAERLGLGTVADAGAGVEGAGLAGALGAAGGPGTAGLALAAWLVSQAWTPGAQRGLPQQMGGLQAAIGSSFGAGALPPITSALYQVSADQRQTAAGTGPVVTDPTLRALVHAGALTPQQAAARQQQELGGYTQQFAGQLADMVTAGPSAIKALNGIGIKGATLTQAFEMMSMAMISPKDWKGGQLDATGQQMLRQFAQTYQTAAIGGQPGTASGLLAAGAANYITASSGMKALSQVNQSMDAMTQIMTGGPAGQAALTGLLQGIQTAYAPTPGVRGAPTATGAFAKALGSGPFTAAGAQAWQTFIGSSAQPGPVLAQQANLDQIRTYLTLGAISGQQGAQLGAFDLKSILPLARHSPAALAMLQSMGMQANIPGMGYYDPKKSLAQNYAAAMKAITGSAGTAAGAQGILNQGTIATANLPAVAASLITGGMGGPSALQSALTAQMAQQALGLAGQPLLKGGGVNVAALHGLTSSLAAGGVKPGQMTVAVDAILKNLHVPSNLVAKIDAQIKPPHVPDLKGKVTYANDHKPLPTQHASGVVSYSNKVPAPPHPVGYGTIIYQNVISGVIGKIGGHTGQHGLFVPDRGSFGDVNPALLERGELVVPRNMVQSGAVNHLRGKIPGFQAGGLAGPDVPYFPQMGVAIRSALQDMATQLFGDMQQIMQQVAVSGRSGGGYGFPLPGGGLRASGPGQLPHGTVSSPVAVHVASVSPAAAASGGFAGAPLPVPAAAQKVFDAFERTFKGMGSPWGRLASQILTGLEDGIKNAPHETAKMAHALVAKVQQEIAFGRGVTQTAVAGLNLGGMQVATPAMTAGGQPYQYYIDQQNIAAGGQPGSVQEQMGSYLQAMQSFQGDMGKLAKGGLEKRLLSQLYAAGPIQGDAEAQSILGGQGGIKGANQLYNQINSLATKLGVSAIGNVYGQPATHPALQGKAVKVAVNASIAPVHALQSAINGLHGKTVTIHVNVTTGGGGGAALSPAQVKQVTAAVQAKLLQQAKTNRRTGITLPGYGS